MVEKIALGTAQFGLNYGISNTTGQTGKEEVASILSLATDIGIRTLDTAQAYGNAEKVLGANDIRPFDVVSKIIVGAEDSVKALVQNSLDNLKVDRLDAVLFHGYESVTDNPAAYKQLNDLKNQGIVSKTGYSLYRPQELNRLNSQVRHSRHHPGTV